MKKLTHRILIKIIDKARDGFIDEFGRKCIYTKWIEVKKLNLGSVRKPNKKVIEFKLIPFKNENGINQYPINTQ